MRKSSIEGVPFGIHRQTGKLMDITEVARGTSCDCICPGCKTELVAKQGDIKLWHFAHSTAIDAECNGLMAAIMAKVLDVITSKGVIAFPHLIEGCEGGAVQLSDIKENIAFCGITAPLMATINQLRIAIFPDIDRTVASRLSFDHIHPSEMIAALRIDLPDIEYELAKVQRGEIDEGYGQCIERLITTQSSSREWLYHPHMHQLEQTQLKKYIGREPAEVGPLRQRLVDHGMEYPSRLPGSRNGILELKQRTIVQLCRLTARPSRIAQTDEFSLFTRYFRAHCLDSSEHVSISKLDFWSDMVTGSEEGERLTCEEVDFLKAVEEIARLNIRLQTATSQDKENVTGQPVTDSFGGTYPMF